MRLPSTRLTIALGLITVSALLVATRLGGAEPVSVGDIGPPAPEADETIQEVSDAWELFQKRDMAGALGKLEEAAKKYDKVPPAQVVLAQMYARVNQPLGVRASLERAVAGDPQDPHAYVLLADFDLRSGLVTEADLLYTKAAGLLNTFDKSPERKRALEPRVAGGQAAVAEARRDWATAQEHLEQLERLLGQLPDDAKGKTEALAKAMERLGRALFKQNKTQEALDKIKAAKEANPDGILTPGATMAILYKDADDISKASEWMKYALSQAQNDLATRLVAAQFYLETGQLDKAKDQAAAAMQINSASLQAKILRGVVALFQKDYKAAELYFESAHLQSPSNFAASNNLALALCEQDDNPKKLRALEYARTNARQYTQGRNAAEAASTYGWVLYKLKRLADAKKALDRAVSAGTFSPDTAYYYARVLADLDRKDDAKRLLETTLNTSSPFSKRDEAQALLNELNR